MDEKIIFLVGFMGSGKSYTGRRLAEARGRRFVDLDTVIEAHAGMDIPAIFAQHGETGFRAMERTCLHQMADVPEPVIVATGGGAPCFFDNMAWMNAHGHTIWLNPPLEVLVERLLPERAHRPLLAAIPEEELASFIRERLDARRVWYAQAKEVWGSPPP